MINLSPIPDGIRSQLLGWGAAMDNSTSSGPASWGEANVKGKITQTRIGQACNSGIQSAAYVVGLRTYKPSELAKRWFEWFVDRSPYAAFVTADDQSILLSGELPSNVLVACLIMQRQPREHPQVIEFMFELVDKFGCPEDLAFLIAFSVTYSDMAGVNTNHYPIAPESGKGMTYWENFLSRRPVKLHDPFVRSNSYRGGVFALWGDAGSYSTDGAFFDEMKKASATETSGTKIVIPNPFAPVVKAGSYASAYSRANARELVPGLMARYDRKEISLAA